MSDLVFQSLVLYNFKRFLGKHRFVLNRPPGLYYITGSNKVVPRLGANGVGKTSIWDALLWCFTGTTGRDRKPGDAIEPWTLDGEPCWVSTKFTRLGSTYRLKRSRAPNELVLKHNGKKWFTTQQEVEQLLGMSDGMLRRTVVLTQFGSLFLDLGPEKQSQMFNEALNLDLWLRASELAKRKFKETNRSLVGLRIEQSRLDGRARELEASLAAEREKRNEYARTQESQLDKVAKKIKANKKARLALLREAPAQQTRNEEASKEAGTPQSRMEALEDAIREKTRELGRNSSERGAVGNKIRGLRSSREEYDRSRSSTQTCPDCGQRVDKRHLDKKISVLDKRLTKHKRQANALDEQINQLETEIGELEDEHNKLQELNDKLWDLRSERQRLKDELQRLRDQPNPHRGAVRDLRGRLEGLRDARASTEEQIGDLELVAGRCAFWQRGYKEIRLKLIDRVLTELEMAATRHTEALGMADCRVEFQTERVKDSGDVTTVFNTLLYMPESKKPIKWESYSGGESKRWQLATAFGLSEVLLSHAGVNPNIEVLDEPTKDMSPEGADDLLEHLRERALELGRAIYIVFSHDFERSLFDGTIMVERTKHGSRIMED